MLLLAGSGRATYQRVQTELREVEARFAVELRSDLECVNHLTVYAERYRGKLLRPMLVFASALATTETPGEISDAHRVVATVVEMIHMGSLVHDDVLDEARIRRGGATINHLWGNEAAVMLGDYLLSHAYHLCARLEQPWVHMAIARTSNTVCEGELLQFANRENWSLDEQTYFQVIRRKTASLCGACCEIAASLNDSPAAEQLYSFGEDVGVAFQIVDDLLDLVGDEGTVGKTLRRDLEKGKLTLPLIYHLRAARLQPRAELLQIISGARQSPLDDAAMSHVRQLLEVSGAVEYARRRAQTLVEQACQRLEVLADGEAKETLVDLARALLVRSA
jgi:octaprenyl-diphosphate synthase